MYLHLAATFLYHRYTEEKKPQATEKYDAVDEEFASKKFLEIGSPAASLRLIKVLNTQTTLSFDEMLIT